MIGKIGIPAENMHIQFKHRESMKALSLYNILQLLLLVNQSKLLLPVSLLSLCFFKRQRYVLVKDANIPQSQDLPQNVTPEPAEGWGDKNDDTLRDVKTLTRSESFEPPCDAAGNYIDLQSALDGQIARPPAAMNEGKVEKEIAEMKNDDEKAMQKMS